MASQALEPTMEESPRTIKIWNRGMGIRKLDNNWLWIFFTALPLSFHPYLYMNLPRSNFRKFGEGSVSLTMDPSHFAWSVKFSENEGWWLDLWEICSNRSSCWWQSWWWSWIEQGEKKKEMKIGFLIICGRGEKRRGEHVSGWRGGEI